MSDRPAPKSEREVGRDAREYVNVGARLARIDAEERATVEKARKKAASRREALQPVRLLLHERIQTWADDNRDGRMTIELPYGCVLKWRRPSSAKLIVKGKLETIARLLLRFPNWRKYLEVSLKKNNIKADLPELQSVPGLRRALSLDDTEYFYIT